MENIIIRIIDPRTQTEYDYPLNASTSDRLLTAILTHIDYQGDGNGAMAAAIDFWIQQSQDVYESQVRAEKAREAAEEIEISRQELS